MFEQWCCDNCSGWVERTFFPDWLTPNAITIIGNIPQLVMLYVMITEVGVQMTAKEPANERLLMIAACALQWFSQFDIMDGIRARRLKAGSPLGRIVDEAGDTIMQACYSMWLAYSFRFDNLCFETVFIMVNFVFYAMEMKFVMCKDLKMVVGEIGPVEVELLLSCIIFFVAYFGGVDSY